MTRPTGRSMTLVLGTGPEDGATVAALRLAEAAVQRGHRVAVYAYGDGRRAAAEGSATAAHATALLRRGVHAGLASWVVDRTRDDGAARPSVEGAISGHGGHLWRFVGSSDIVLGVSR